MDTPRSAAARRHGSRIVIGILVGVLQLFANAGVATLAIMYGDSAGPTPAWVSAVSAILAFPLVYVVFGVPGLGELLFETFGYLGSYGVTFVGNAALWGIAGVSVIAFIKRRGRERPVAPVA